MFAVVMSPVFYSCRENHVCNNFAFSFQNHIRTFITFPITLVHRKLRFSREPRGKLECVCLADKCSIEWRWANYKIHSLRSSENEEARNLCLKFLRCECLPRNRNRMWLKIVNIFWLRYVIWIRIYKSTKNKIVLKNWFFWWNVINWFTILPATKFDLIVNLEDELINSEFN